MGFKNTGKLKTNDEIIKEFQLVHGRKYTIYGQSYINPLNTM